MANEPRDKILMALSNEWKSTNKIKNEASLNWYRTEYFLNKLHDEGRVQKDEKNSGTTYWRVKGNGDTED